MGLSVASCAFHDPDRGAEADEFEMRRIAFNDASEADHPVIFRLTCKGLRHDRQFERSWCVKDFDIVYITLGKPRHGALAQTTRHVRIESAHQYREAWGRFEREVGRLGDVCGHYFSPLKSFKVPFVSFLGATRSGVFQS